MFRTIGNCIMAIVNAIAAACKAAGVWPFIATNDATLMTLPVGLQTVKNAYGIQYAQNMASAVLAALPLILVFLFFQRQIIKGISTTGFGGQ